MIVITGALGFIGSCLVRKLNDRGHRDLCLVDDFSKSFKSENLNGKDIACKVERMDFFDWMKKHHTEIEFIFHLGARTDTTEMDERIFEELNLQYSKNIWSACSKFEVPLLYASSAATYGLGEHGYVDDHSVTSELEPLNPYGISKNEFDKWALCQLTKPPHWTGLKFFNVYGPNEYHKGRMASVIFHAVNQIRETASMKLFKSHNPAFVDGEQKRDFIYVKDVVDICYFMYDQRPDNGLYNVGTGNARTFWDLACATFQAMNIEPEITFIDTPEDIRDKYQYFTEADESKLHGAGYNTPFTSLEKGIHDYVTNFLINRRFW